jgi:broad specificity phosphatase PhoE
MLLRFSHLISAALLTALLFAPFTTVSANEVPRVSFAQAADKMRGGGYLLMMRHAQTVAGVGDPENFKLDDCATQRNLSPEGREQARSIGRAFEQVGIKFDSVRSSQWCRTRETARLAFGTETPWPALNSSFRNRSEQTGRTQQILEFGRTLNPPQNVMLVTHQITITALVGNWVDSGEVLAFRFEGDQLKPQFRLIPP